MIKTGEQCEMNSNDPYIQLCNHIASNIKQKENDLFEEMKANFQSNFIKKECFFVMEGDIPDKLAFITKGLMKIFIIDLDGNEWVTNFCAENTFCTSYFAYLNQTESEMYVQAMEDTEYLYIRQNVYNQLLYTSLTWSNNARIFTEKLFAESEKRQQALLKLKGEERYQQFKNEYREIFDRIPQKDIASYIGLTPVSLSRIRKQLG